MWLIMRELASRSHRGAAARPGVARLDRGRRRVYAQGMCRAAIASLALLLVLGACDRGGGGTKLDEPKDEMLVGVRVVELEPRRPGSGGAGVIDGPDIVVRPAERVAAPGVSFYDAVMMVPDHPGHRCAVHARKAYCGEEILTSLVPTAGLAADPSRLDDGAWLTLVAWVLAVEALAGPDDLPVTLEERIPAAARAAVHPAKITRGTGGVPLIATLWFVRSDPASYPTGPIALMSAEVTVAAAGVKVATTEHWSSAAGH